MFNQFRLGFDRLILSKGHAAPLLYSLYAAAGMIKPAELYTLRKFGSQLEGHPTPKSKLAEVATGSLGQGLAVGLGLALNAKYLDKTGYLTYVLLGDSEMAEGSNWEAMSLASHYQLDNLIALVDVNRLGQRGETMHGWNLAIYQAKAKAFGWATKIIDGHDFNQITAALALAGKTAAKPLMILAKTVKGKGVPFWENQDGWHGKALNQDQYREALKILGPVKEQTWTIKSAS
jgi:transketolase